MNILSMSGFVPEQICDTIRFEYYHGDRNMSHYCGYASDFISQVLEDKSIDGAVYPKSCDSTRVITSYLEKSGKFLFQMPIPLNEDIGFCAALIKVYKEKVESCYGISINDIADRIEMVNQRNEKLGRMYADISEISFSDYIIGIHNMLKRPLAEQKVVDEIVPSKGGKSIFLVGSFLANTNIAIKMEEVGLRVVGDTLTESGRLVSARKTEVIGDVYCNIAKSIFDRRLSPTQDNFKAIVKADMEEIRRKGAKGVLFITQKYCEPYDYLFSIYKAYLDAVEIPVIRIILNDTEDSRKAELELEAFAEMI